MRTADTNRIDAVTSAANPLLKDVRRAIARGGLTDEGWCVAESFHLLEEALRSERDVPVVLASESVENDGGAARLRTARTAHRGACPTRLFQTHRVDRDQPGSDRAGRAAGVVDRSAVPRPEPGGRARRLAGPGQCGRHRARGGGVRRHRR